MLDNLIQSKKANIKTNEEQLAYDKKLPSSHRSAVHIIVTEIGTSAVFRKLIFQVLTKYITGAILYIDGYVQYVMYIQCVRRNFMKIIIKNKSELPIYEQIEQQMKTQILEGAIKEDEQLPSIRQLAKDLKISVITTTRVYNDLSDEGFIISVAGKGYFVASRNNDLLKERMLCEMEEGLEKAVENGRNAGLSDDEIIEALKNYLRNAE